MEQILNKKRMWLKRTADFAVGIIFVFLFFLLAMPAEAGNQQITFQGKLTNASGNTVSNGTYYVKLTIYDAATGGSCQYTASSTCASVTSTPVTVTNGIFSINLGDTSAALAAMSSTLFNNSALYLGITVCSGAGTGCDSEMTPRKRITAAPYAFNADYLSGLATSTIGGQGSYVPVTDSSGNFTISNKVFVATTTAGQFGVGTTTVPTGVKSYVEGTTASDKLLVVRGNGSQTGNLQEWQNNAGTALVAVDSSGNVSTSGTLRTFGNIGIAMAPSYPLDVAGFINVDQYSGYKQAGNTILTASSTNVSTLVGSDAGFALKATAQYNTAVGYQALYSTTLSDNNTAIGYLALYSDTSGYNNTANGANSLFSNTTGRNNTASGVQSMLQNTSGDGNTAGGWRSMMNNTTGNSSTAYGAESLNSNTTGYNNTANGFRALYNNTTGADNTSLGFQAGYNSSVSLATLTSSTFVGSNASVSTNGLTNVVVIGSTAQATASNQVVLGNTSITQTLLRGNVGIGYNSPSDKLTVYGGNLRVGDGTVSSTLGTNFFAVATSTTNMNGLFYIDSSGNVSASGTLAAFNNATIGGHIYPSSDNLYDVGASSTQWRYGNFQGGVLIGNGVTSSTFANNSFSLGQRNVTYESGLFRIDSSGNLFTSGTVALTDTSGGVVSSTANFLRLSADGANQLQFWTSASQRMYIDSSGNIFASGTLQSTGNTYFYSNTTFGDAVGDAITITGRLSTLNVSDGSTATSSLANNSLTIGQVLGTFNSGYFNVDLSGNVSASGTLGVFGNATLLGSLSATSNTSSLRSLYLSGLTATPNTLAGTLYFNSADAKFYGYTANGTAVDLGSTGGTNDWGRFSSTYGALALMTSSTYPVWFDGNVYASSTLTVSGTTSASSTVITGTSLVVGRGAGWQGGVFSVDASGNIASSSTLNVAGGPNPAGSVWHPTHKSVLTDSASYNLKGAYSVFVSGNYAYVAANVEDALSIVDVSNPASTTYKGSYSNSTLLDGANSVFVSGNYAYVTADTADTLAIIDISNPANPTLKGSLTDSTNMDNPQSVFVSGNYAYVVGGPQVSGGTLVVIDVSNPTNPILTGVINNGDGGATLRGANYVFVSGKYAYVSANTNGTDALEIVDISNPRSPVHAGKLSDAADNLLNGPTEVFVSGNYAYVVSNGDDGLEIVDISNPANPLHKGSLANGTGGALLLNSESIFVSGNYAYIGADSSAVLEIVDISDPANPVHKSNIVDGSGGASLASPYSVFVSGNYAYVADYSGTSGSLEIVDISGAVISNARIGALNVDTLQINNFAQFDQGILVRSGLNVGGPTQLLGDVSIGGGRATSTNMSGGGLTIFTNQASSTFTSRVLDASNSTGFIFNSGTSTWTGADRNLVSFQTGGTDKFLFAADGSMVVNKGSGSNLGKFYVDSSGNVSASGTLAAFGNTTIGGHLYPSLDNLYDIGASSTQWRYGNFQSGILIADGSTTSTLLNTQFTIGDDGTTSTQITKNTFKLGIDTGSYRQGVFNIDAGGNVNASGSLLVANNLTIGDGSQVAFDNLRVKGYVQIDNTLTVTGSITANGSSSNAIQAIVKGANGQSVNLQEWRNNGGKQLAVVTSVGNIQAGSGTVSSTLGVNNTLILAQQSGVDLGYFYVDSSGNVSASGTLAVFGNSTLGDSDAAGGDTTRAYGSLAMGAAATGNAQLFLKATSTIAVPFLVQDSNSNVIGKLASSTAEGLANGAQVTVTDYSLLTVGDAAGLTGAVSLRSNRSSGALVIYRNATAIGTQLTAGTLIMSGDGSVTSTLGNSTFTLSQDSTANSGRFYIDSNGNTSASGTLRVFSSISGGGLQISATSATTTFTSYVTDSVGATAFEFMSSVIMTSGTDRALAVFRNGDSAGRNKVVISAAGNVYAAQGFIAGSSNYGIGDVAEYVNLVAGEIGEPGDVLVVDKINYNQYKKSSAPNTKEVAGVISDTGAFIMGASGPGRASLALAGLVKVKITDENGPVAVGDYLTTASKPGYAMRFDADAGISAGLVGMALEPWESGDGKITILVNKGLAVGNAAVSTLNASENGAGQLVWGNDLNLHLSGRSILDVLSIKSQDEKWVIDEEGYLVVKVETQQGDKMLYGLQSGQDKEVVFSGSSQLEDGVKEIELPTIDKEIIDLEAPIKVSVTLTGEANGVFVTDKSYEGFTVKELNSGASDATFDWMVIAKRRAVGDESVENDEVVEDVESVEENSGDIIIDAEALPEEIITPEVSETSEELALETTEDVPPEVDVTIVEELIPDSGEDTASSTPAESASE